jgi:hypothetical protein
MNRAAYEYKASPTRVSEHALQELQERIEASGLESTYAGMVCDLCVGQASLEQAFGEIHQKAMEHMVGLIDTSVLDDEATLDACLEKIAMESERVAWRALERGTEALREGIEFLEGSTNFAQDGYVN